MYANRISHVSLYGISPISKGSGGKSAGSFYDTYQQQLKEHYKDRVAALFDEISEQAENIVDHVDISKFEKYCQLIGDLIREVINNAYSINSERILDHSGKQRIFTTVNIVDNKLEDLASDLIRKNSDRLDYLRRVDEIRGLVMDMLL